MSDTILPTSTTQDNQSLRERKSLPTPGPWRWYKDTEDSHGEGEYSDLGSPNGTVLSYSVKTAHANVDFSACIEVSEANARLIAAAPDLLQACRALYHAMLSYKHGNASPELSDEVAKIAEAAIRKAEGAEVK